MQFVKPVKFDEAVQKLGTKRIIARDLSSDQWSNVAVGLRDAAFWSAHVTEARMVQDFKNGVTDFIEKNLEDVTLDDGTKTTQIKMGGRAQFVRDMKEKYGGKADEGGGPITDKTSTSRLQLIFDVQMKSAYGFGQWQEGNNPVLLDAFPAARFIRIGYVQEPRPLHETNKGQVRLKSDLEFWLAMNSSAIGGFEVPWPPFGFNSQMDLEDVSRAEAEAMGLIAPGEQITPPDMAFDEHLEASVKGLDPDVREALVKKLGKENVEVDGDRVKWKRLEREFLAENPPPTKEPVDPIKESVSVLDDFKSKIEPLTSEAESIDERLGVLRRKNLSDEGLSQKEYAERAALRIRQTELEPKIKQIRDDARLEVHAMLTQDNPGRFKADIGTREGKKALEFVNNMTGEAKAINDDFKIRQEYADIRSYCSYKSKEIVLYTEDPSVLVHECGHAIEASHPEVYKAAQQFLADRVDKGLKAEVIELYKIKPPDIDRLKPNYAEWQAKKADIEKRYRLTRLTELTGWGDSSEWAWGDKFKDMYAGKYYPDATEVVSMGLQQLYTSPIDFYASDPDYYKFTVRVLRGIKHEVVL